MKTNKILLQALFILSSIFFLSSCLDDKINDIKNSTSDFDYSTIKKINVSIFVSDYSNAPMNDVLIQLYTQNPVYPDGTFKSDCENNLIYKGTTNNSGFLNCAISPATTADTLYVFLNQIGFPAITPVSLNTSEINLSFGGKSSNIKSNVGIKKAQSSIAPSTLNGFYTLGTFNSFGTPYYLITSDVITASLLSDINATLPEGKKLPDTRPEFFDNPTDGSIKLYEDAEVFVTFVHEGAGWTNTLTYYTYSSSTPPSTVNDISNKIIVFPNVSFLNSGGGLASGNKVQLQYLDPATKTFTNIFPKGTTVAWAFQAQGWNGSTVKALNSNLMWYSDFNLNTETDKSKNKHNVVLNDADRKILLIGFEDMRRDNGSDEDYNDAIFYATTNPVTAINPDDYDKVIKAKDTDKDGVSDSNDDYPNDPTIAHNNYYPSKGKYGTLAFEDLWPMKGDYDFNDLVVDYNYNQITNANNEVVTLEANYVLRATGANYVNGFGVQFNTVPENISSVTGQNITDNLVKLNSNGTEMGQSKAVIIVFDNSYNSFKLKSGSGFINTVKGNNIADPISFNLKINLVKPINASSFGSAPYNPFIYVSKDRSKEVHLPKCIPTDLVNKSYFGTKDDDTDFSKLNYYMSNTSLPWALNLPVQFDYPSEKSDITKTFLLFNDWAQSNGSKKTDWYLNKANYRDTKQIYSK